jgi:hypothetical protein
VAKLGLYPKLKEQVILLKGMIMVRNSLFIFLLVVSGCVEVDEEAFSNVRQQDGKTYIYDRTGDKWDITQAMTLGFKPEKFQYGIGKNAFTPLDDSRLTDGSPDLPGNLRVIGIEEGADSRAYSVRRLSRHEISNSTLGGKPVAVGY